MKPLEPLEVKGKFFTVKETSQQLQKLIKNGDVRLSQYADNETELDSILAGLAWLDEFKHGHGVNAINGETTGSALKKFEPVERNTKTSTQYYKLIQHQSDANLEVQASLSGHYNINGVTVSASVEYLKHLEVSELTTTLLARYESTHVEYDEAEKYELTDEAKKLLQENPDKFRDAYGDYFISGGKKGSRFVALYICRATSLKDMTSFKASLGGEAPNVFRVDGSTSIAQSAHENNIKMEIMVFMEGYHGTPPPPTEPILKQLEWFKNHETGIYLRAKLRHYSTINPGVSRTVKIAPAAFSELRQIYNAMWTLRARYTSCPVNYQIRFTEEFNDIDTEIVSRQSRLAVDAELRLTFKKKIDNLNRKLEGVYSRMSFYFEVLSRAKDEVESGKYIKQEEGEIFWSYGMNRTYVKEGVEINVEYKQVRPSAAVGYGKDTINFTEDYGKLIVGWSIKSLWNKNNGWWMKMSDQIILKQKAEFAFWSILSSYAEWGADIYYVDASEYKFDQHLAQISERSVVK